MVSASLRRLARRAKLPSAPSAPPAPPPPPPPFQLELPDHLKRPDLAHLAASCGLKIDGTKPLVRGRLCAAMADYRPLDDGEARVLSIDMGIRNFGFAMFSLPANRPRAPKRDLPVISAWKGLALDRDPTLLADIAPALPATPPPAPAEPSSAEPEPAKAIEFTPAVLSQIAARLVHSYLLPLRPTHVLIENQRYRTTGSTRIHEWTLRVNMLEAMLYSTLETLRSVGRWDGAIISVLPSHVGRFLLKTDEVDAKDAEEKPRRPARKSNKAAAQDAQQEQEELQEPLDEPPVAKPKKRGANAVYMASKGRKLDLLASWLDQETWVRYGDSEVEAMANTLLTRRGLRKREKKPKGAAAPAGPKLTKLDDVADCLMQGLVWLRWNDNLRLLAGGGWQAVMARCGMYGE